MFPRNAKFFVILSGFLIFAFVTFWTLNFGGDNDSRAAPRHMRLEELEHRVDQLKSRVADDDRLIKELRSRVDDSVKSGGRREAAEDDANARRPQLPRPLNSAQQTEKDGRRFGGNKVQNVHEVLTRKGTASLTCPATNLPRNATSDVQMLNAYDIIPFNNPDGGVWKQGWDITYDAQTIRDEPKLEVFVVPHSHDDPGWLKTFDDYFYDDVRNILNKMSEYLRKNGDMKFIYAEISFFEQWWSGVSDTVRASVKSFLKNGQFEIVTGGWVMTDEASSNYFASIMELIEGHEFMTNQLDTIPKNHWSIDPFGLSPTVAYLMNRANFSNMAVQRVHYSVKKYLAQRKSLEFRWRQLFAGGSASTDMMTHMFPFYSYDVPHTCGPNPKVCCQFDFRRLNAFFCPWGTNPKVITDDNVDERARLLVDQYRKKAQLYQANVLLVPLGDDFRYNTDMEWAAQHVNYRRLMTHINAQPEWNMNVRFGTLADYFEALHKRERAGKSDGGAPTNGVEFPVLSGDFFTYADRDDHYWSGYFTSRPFYKQMDRTLQHYLRSADILFTMAYAQSSNAGNEVAEFAADSLYDRLVEARRSLSLFQHHDGVTGTGKDFVMKDYGEKMLLAINNCKTIITSASQYLMRWPTEYLKIDEDHFLDSLPQKSVIEDGSSFVVFNSLVHSRQTVVCVQVGSPKSRVGRAAASGTASDEVVQQIAPIIFVDGDTTLSAYKDKFELCFMATLAPLSFTRYNVFESEDVSHKVKIHSSSGFSSPFFDVSSADDEVVLKNSLLTAKFDPKTGLLQSVRGRDDSERSVKMSFVKYGARTRNPHLSGDSVSGAYLFLPDGPASELPTNENAYVWTSGSVRESVFVKGVNRYALEQIVSLDRDANSLRIRNFIDLSRQRTDENTEVAMRLVTDVGADDASEERFFTDLNNFQMIRRRRFDKLPLQAHFYPMAGALYLEDSAHRVSLLSRQALGVANLERGWMEVMLDRRLLHDDDRGLAEGVLDNQRTESRFELVVERLSSSSSQKRVDAQKETVGYHSLAVNSAQTALHYPPMVMAGRLDEAQTRDVPTELSKIDENAFSCDVHLVAIRTLSHPTVYTQNVDANDVKVGTDRLWTADSKRSTKPKRSAAFILHRYGADCGVAQTDFGDNAAEAQNGGASATDCRGNFGQVQMESIFTSFQLKSTANASLTLLYHSAATTLKNLVQSLEPMELQTLKLNF